MSVSDIVRFVQCWNTGTFCWPGGSSSAVCVVLLNRNSAAPRCTQYPNKVIHPAARQLILAWDTQIMGSCSESWFTSSSSMLVRRLQWPKPLIFCLFASGASVILPQELSRIWNKRLRDCFREQRRLWQPAAGVVWVLASTSRQSGKPTRRQPTRNRCS